MNTLIENVRQWFYDKGIIENSNPLKQLGKTQEELTETRDAVVKLTYAMDLYNDHGMYFTEDQIDDLMNDIQDGIGDTVVTLIGICEMENIDLMQLITNENNKNFVDELPDEPIKVLDKAQEVLTDIVMNRCIGRYASSYCSIGWLGCCMVFLSGYYGVTLEECLQQAYDVISKRTGRMENGVFVKDKEVTNE